MANENQKRSGGFFQDNKNTLIVAAIVIIVLAVYFSTRDKTTVGTQNDRTDTEQSEEMKDDSSDSMEDTDKMAEGDKMDQGSKPSPTPTPTATGNVQLSGMLKISQDTSKGNYMVASDRGIVYLQTGRDLSAWVDKNVIVNAEGNISQFSITDITPADGSTTDDKGGANETPDMAAKPEVSFSGTLQKSDNAKGNYSITNGKTVIYMQTSKDYSGWVGKMVKLEAQGTLASFHHAMLTVQ